MRHGFIGFGNLAKAIYHGLQKNKAHDFAYISKHNAHQEIRSFKNLPALISFADVIWLCVKPQNLEEVLTEMKKVSLRDKIIISPVAGKQIRFIEKYLGKKTAILRIMPNLAVAYQKSVTAFCANDRKSKKLKRIKKDLDLLGQTVELPEKHFDLFTALFGSGPAFLLALLETVRKKIKELGVSNNTADELLAGLLAGTLTYFQENRAHGIAELIKKITSKGGTTEAGLKEFKKNKLDKRFENVIIAAQRKAKRME